MIAVIILIAALFGYRRRLFKRANFTYGSSTGGGGILGYGGKEGSSTGGFFRLDGKEGLLNGGSAGKVD